MRITSYEPHPHPRIRHYEPHKHPRIVDLDELDPQTGLPRPRKHPLTYITRGCGGVWKRHHHVSYSRRVAVACSSGDSVPHAWGY